MEAWAKDLGCALNILTTRMLKPKEVIVEVPNFLIGKIIIF
jgi:hypothetical protein